MRTEKVRSEKVSCRLAVHTRNSMVGRSGEVEMRASVLILFLGLASCSIPINTPSSSPGQDQAHRDVAACRADAESRLSPSEYIPPGQEQATNSNQLMMQNYTIQKHYEAMVNECLQSRGYPSGK